MQEITITLTDTMKEYVDARIASGEYSSITELFNHLLREEQTLRAKDYLKTKVREAEASGELEEITAEYWDEIRRTFQQKYIREQSPS